MSAAMTVTLVEFEFKSATGNAKRFRVPVMPSSGYAKVTLDLGKDLSANDLEQINEVLLHLSGQGRLKQDGFLK